MSRTDPAQPRCEAGTARLFALSIEPQVCNERDSWRQADKICV
jgi:hypothetical protein